jgi:hypothetical protein
VNNWRKREILKKKVNRASLDEQYSPPGRSGPRPMATATRPKLQSWPCRLTSAPRPYQTVPPLPWFQPPRVSRHTRMHRPPARPHPHQDFVEKQLESCLEEGGVNRQTNLKLTRFKLIKTWQAGYVRDWPDMSCLGPDISGQTGSRAAKKQIGRQDDESMSR